MASFGAQKLVEEIKSDGDGDVGLVSPINGVDQSPVVPRPLISEHPVDDGTHRFPIGRSKTFLENPHSTFLNGGGGAHVHGRGGGGHGLAKTKVVANVRGSGSDKVNQGVRCVV